MNHPDLVFTGNGDHLLKEFQVNALAGGVAGVQLVTGLVLGVYPNS